MLVPRQAELPAALLLALVAAGPALAAQSAPKEQKEAGIGNPPPKIAINDGLFVMLPNGRVLGALSVRNNDTQPHMITGFSSPDCATLDMEQWDGSPPNNGPLRMTVPGKAKMVFLRGGYHLQCVAPSHPFHAGDMVPVTVTFRDLPPSKTVFEVKAYTPPPPRRLD